LQLNIVYGAAVPASNASPEPALALVKFLADPANRIHWKDAGFDPPGS
jgi:ABC-type molybdate transport system substrate-binding protein